jgi:hypothetical protein
VVDNGERLERRAKDASNIFAEPAAQHSVSQSDFIIHPDFVSFRFYGTDAMSGYSCVIGEV